MQSTKNFYDWCVENNRIDILDRWNYNLNVELPQNVTYTSHNKFYFNCDKHVEHRPSYVCLSSLTSGGQNIRCFECISFAQWVIDNYNQEYLDKIWNVDLNVKSPWEISAKSHCDIYLNCLQVEYHKGYRTTAARFTNGQKICGFCHGLQVHPKESFAAYNIKKYGDDFLDKYWDYELNTEDPCTISHCSGKIIYIKCQDKEYHGSYRVRASDFSLDKSKCPYCRSLKVHPLDSVGSIYPQILNFWSDKNELTPFDYSINCDQKVWLKCPDGIHEDYYKRLRDAIKVGFACPQCAMLSKESKIEKSTRLYLNNNYTYRVEHEYLCSLIAVNPITGRNMPYDNDVFLNNNVHLIIEVHGRQHYERTKYTAYYAKRNNISIDQALKDQQTRDKIKKEHVESLKNYYYLELPYWTFEDESYKTLIDNKIQEILNNTKLI